MDKTETNAKEKIILPENLQREMLKFFLRSSMKKNAKPDKEKKQTSETQKEGC